MSIAAIIPTYNAAAFLEGTLASVNTQTLKPDEVIVVDDASTDDTAAIARRLGATVIVLPQNSGGPAVPLNTGIAVAKSDWIATLDHDDRWRPDWLATAAEAATLAKVEFVFGRVNAVPANADMQATLDAIGSSFRERGDAGAAQRIAHGEAYRRLADGRSYAVTCSNMLFTRRLGTAVPFDPTVSRCCDFRFTQQVTHDHDIAFANTVSCDWVNSPTSLYQQGSMDKLDRDLMTTFKQFDVSLFKTHFPQWQSLRQNCRKTANDLAFAARNRGEYRRSFTDYCDSVRYGGFNRTALLGMVKLPLLMLRGPRS
ncbi:hypothetical protein BH11PLA2_BH11PLA2_44390 [soil metagenome]